jgi:uncharacterized protein YgfB (UPF0149 family)
MDYRVLGETLERAGSSIGLAELHGGMCGSLCAGGVTATGRWISGCLRDCATEEQQREELSQELGALQLRAWQALVGSEMNFELALPGDERSLEERVQALALWCHGFLVGFGSTGLALETAVKTSEHLGEVVRDFTQITRAGLGEEEIASPTQADFALAELLEYVRISVQLVFDELASLREAPRPLH